MRKSIAGNQERRTKPQRGTGHVRGEGGNGMDIG